MNCTIPALVKSSVGIVGGHQGRGAHHGVPVAARSSRGNALAELAAGHGHGGIIRRRSVGSASEPRRRRADDERGTPCASPRTAGSRGAGGSRASRRRARLAASAQEPRQAAAPGLETPVRLGRLVEGGGDGGGGQIARDPLRQELLAEPAAADCGGRGRGPRPRSARRTRRPRSRGRRGRPTTAWATSSGAPAAPEARVSSRPLQALRANRSKAASLAAFASSVRRSRRAAAVRRPARRHGLSARLADARRLGERPDGLAGRRSRPRSRRSCLSQVISPVEKMPLTLRSKSSGLVAGVARGLVGDQLLAIELQQRLVEGLHAVLRCARGDDVGDLRRLVRLPMHSRTRPVAIMTSTAGTRPLPSARATRRWETMPWMTDGELAADLVLLVRREDRDDPVDGLGRVQRVERGEHQVAGLRRVQRRLDGLDVAHLADQDDVGVLAQGGAQGLREARRVLADLALADHALLVLVHELDRVLDRDDMVVARCGSCSRSWRRAWWTCREPVMPVTRIRPRRSMASRSSTLGRCSSSKAGMRSGMWRNTAAHLALARKTLTRKRPTPGHACSARSISLAFHQRVVADARPAGVMAVLRMKSRVTSGRSSCISRWPWIRTMGRDPDLRCRSEALRFAHSVSSCCKFHRPLLLGRLLGRSGGTAPAAADGLRPSAVADLGLEVARTLGLSLQVPLGVLAPLPDPLGLVGVPGAGLLDDVLLDAQVEDRALLRRCPRRR